VLRLKKLATGKRSILLCPALGDEIRKSNDIDARTSPRKRLTLTDSPPSSTVHFTPPSSTTILPAKTNSWCRCYTTIFFVVTKKVYVKPFRTGANRFQ